MGQDLEFAYRAALEAVLACPDKAVIIARRALAIPDGSGWVGRVYYRDGRKAGHTTKVGGGWVAGLINAGPWPVKFESEGEAKHAVEVAVRRQSLRLV